MLNTTAWLVGIVEGEVLESKSIVDSVSFFASYPPFSIQLTIRLIQGVDKCKAVLPRYTVGSRQAEYEL